MSFGLLTQLCTRVRQAARCSDALLDNFGADLLLRRYVDEDGLYTARV